MKRLILFGAIPILLAWGISIGIPEAIYTFLFFAGTLCIIRFLFSLLSGEEHTWTLWCERITKLMVIEGAIFIFLWIDYHLGDLPQWWGNDKYALLTGLEVLPSLIFLSLSRGFMRISFKHSLVSQK